MRKMLKLVLMCASIATAIATASPAHAMRASWYGVGDGSGSHTADGTKFIASDPTIAAHRELPFGTKLRVSYKSKSLCMTVRDRGPFTKRDDGRYDRDLDVSYGAARHLDMIKAGVVNLKVKINGC